jgi:flagellar biosynthetic protein FlhB
MAESQKDERTEEATSRKLEEAREKGQVAYSTEAVSAMGLAIALGTFMVAGGFVAGRLGAMVAAAPTQALVFGERSLDAASFADILRGVGKETLLPLVVLVIPMVIGSLMMGFGQAGFTLAPKAIAADLSKLNPIKGFGRMIGARGWTRVGLAILKIIAIGTALVVTGWLQLPNLLSMATTDLGPMLAGLGAILLRCVAAVLVCVVLLALLDFIFQRFQFAKEQRMTKQEIKEEMKQQEGDPHVKARIRAVQREMANRRMMEDVKGATAVITNPTHYAVAISYPRDADGVPTLVAPLVVAKGVDFLAQNIKKVAREAGVPLHENRPLARAMYARVEIGQPIPEDLYAAMATVLAHVWRTDKHMQKEAALAPQ